MKKKEVKNIIVIGPKNHIHFRRSIGSLTRSKICNEMNIKFIDIFTRKNYLISFIILILRIKINSFIYNRIKREPFKFFVHQAHSYGLAAYLSGVKYDLICWGSDVFEWQKKNKKPKKYVISVLKNAENIYSSSHFMKHHIYNISGLKAKLISLRPNIYFGKNEEIFKNLDFREKLNLITIKSLFEIYGIGDFIDVIANIEDKYRKKIKYDIWGEGPLQEELEKKVNNLGLSNVIKFNGRAKQEDIRSLIKNADILVSPSIQESYGVICLEASGLNTTILGRKIEAYNESTCENINSILLNMNDDKHKKITSRVIVDLLKNRRNIKNFQQKSKNLFIENFNSNSFNSQYLHSE